MDAFSTERLKQKQRDHKYRNQQQKPKEDIKIPETGAQEETHENLQHRTKDETGICSH